VTTVAAIGFIPAAPLLVPQVAGGSAAVDADLRDSCREVARRLAATTAQGGITVVAMTATTTWPDGATWGFEGFGVPRQPPDPRPRLPWPLGIGDWLLDDIGWTGPRSHVGVSADGTATSPAATGDALLLVGDGSARRTEKAPGHLDDRAEPFDATVAGAIRDGDIATLRDLDPAVASELWCAGAPVWRWAMNLLDGRAVAEAALFTDTAPYGVGYFTGWWRLAG
jgi:hypothetical protein